MSDIFDFEKKPDQYAVMGNPINHSKSPIIHKHFANETNQLLNYIAIQVDLGGFTQAVRNFQANGGAGLNITVPFKLEAFNLADDLTSRAKLAGAVNTLIFHDNGKITGDNTDGYGLLGDILDELNWSIQSKRLLVLGAGGATRGILEPLLKEQPRDIFIANRTPSKAKDLADDFSHLGKIAGGGFNDLDAQQFDIVINATSASLQGDIPPVPETIFAANAKSYDLMYGAKPTAFMNWSTDNGASEVVDGLGMLVGQAAESFYQWRGVKPSVKPVIELLRLDMV
ncbi:MAG: shikimate dehydrogenase [Gammaproteobacteria bacterium]|nr:shikimate dehydrogenase [Gammaproteobacteria bacterium]